MHSSRLVDTLLLQNVLNVLIRLLKVLFIQQIDLAFCLPYLANTPVSELALVNLATFVLRGLRFA